MSGKIVSISYLEYTDTQGCVWLHEIRGVFDYRTPEVGVFDHIASGMYLMTTHEIQAFRWLCPLKINSFEI